MKAIKESPAKLVEGAGMFGSADGLSYAAGNGRYSSGWKTDKGWASTCRVLILQPDDATQHLAYSQFK